MGRKPTSSSWLRFLDPSFYLRKPRRLGVLALIFVLAMCFVFDRQNQTRELDALQRQVQELEGEKRGILEEVHKLRQEGGAGGAAGGGGSATGSGGAGNEAGDGGEGEEDSNELTEELRQQKPLILGVGNQGSVADRVVVKRGSGGEGGGAGDARAAEVEKRREAVKAAMVHSWTNYEKYAWGMDELQPVSRSGSMDFGGLGATIIDSLDTLHIMGLHKEFKKARDWVAESLNFDVDYVASTFETTIRVLGGLIAAFDLSGDRMFIDKAVDLADRLSRAYDTPMGLPNGRVNLKNGHSSNDGWTGGAAVLAEFGTQQLEYIGLSQRTGKAKYAELAEKVIRTVRQHAFPQDGLVSCYLNSHDARVQQDQISFGAMGDSFYEYLLKAWVQGGKLDTIKIYRDMWEQSMAGMMGSLIGRTTPGNYTYVAERHNSFVTPKMDHLACFVPGMLALGAYTKPDHPKAPEYLQLAKELTRTCYQFYQSQPSKLSGENYHAQDGMDMVVGTRYNIQRPEAVEAIFYLYRVTGDPMYQDWGWDIFQAFEKQCKVDSGYTGLQDVGFDPAPKDDKMQTFFLAETLKYLYLLFSPTSLISLDEWVFNTEAHPIRIIPRPDPTHFPPITKEAGGGDAVTGGGGKAGGLRGGGGDAKRSAGRKEGLGLAEFAQAHGVRKVDPS